MPTYVNPVKCDGCRGLARTACMYICPNDLMKYDADLGKVFNKEHGMAFNQEPDLCWECFSCVKACPTGAIVMRGYADVVPLGATLTPLRATAYIMWNAKYRGGQVKSAKCPIRTPRGGRLRGGARGGLLGEDERPQGRHRREGRHRAERGGGHGALGHQPLPRHAVESEQARGLRPLRPPGPDGALPRGP